MNKTLSISLAVIAGLVVIALIFGAGMMVGRAGLGTGAYGPVGMMGWGGNNTGYPMMGTGFGMMGAYGSGNGYGMMGGNGSGNGYGMMGGNGSGNGYGMMGGTWSGNSANPKPLSVDQARQAIETYLTGLNNSDLELKEVMIFDNQAYGRVVEKTTGIGAMELLVDPISLSVFPEYGPNMMWNLKYGQMGGMMGGFSSTNPGKVAADMTVAPEEALKIAQSYLDKQFPGYQVAKDADPFYGYYTIDILKDNKPTGMLSVNGFSGQVFLHTWHGTFVELSE